MITRTHTTIETLYTFGELDEQAQCRAVSEFLQYSDELDNIVEEYISDHLHALRCVHYDDAGNLRNNLDYQYSCSFCQGDGFNIYGRLNLVDVLDHMGEDVTEERRELLEGEAVTFEPDRRYTFSKWDLHEYEDALADALENAGGAASEGEARGLAARFCAEMHDHCTTIHGLLCDFILDGAYNPAYHDGVLFDEFGAFACMADDLEWVA